MTQNNNLSVLPFYTSIDEQNHRKSYAYGDIYPLFAPNGDIIPFQILTSYSVTALSVYNAWIYAENGASVVNIATQLVDGGLRYIGYSSDGYGIIFYPAIVPLGLHLDEGRYYLRLSTNKGIFYSEIFTVVTQLSPYLKVEWWNKEDMIAEGWRIAYESTGYQFKNRIYLNTELGKPDYEFEEDGEFRDGYFFPEKQISEKTYKFTFLAPEYLCDVMRFIRMADYIRITDKYGRVYNCDTFLITPKWEVQGNLASVEAEFQTDTVAKKIGCGMITNNLGDYNNDYNNDFNN